MLKPPFVLIVKVNFEEDLIRNTSENYINNIENFNLDQRMKLVDILVDGVYVTVNKDDDIEAEVVFRFAHETGGSGTGMGEPREASIKTKKTPKGLVNCEYGTLEGFDVGTYKGYLKKINLKEL